jgi:hypothetical protein
MPATISFFDMSVSVTPPAGHLEPVPLTLGPNWQQNDIRTLIVAGLATSSDGNTAAAPMSPDPPTGFPAIYNLAPTPGFSTQGVYYRRLVNGDADTSVTWPKPPGWSNYLFTTLTARGATPSAAPVAGRLTWSHIRGDTTMAIDSVTVPAAGSMVFLLSTLPDIDPNGWAVSMGAPTGWTNLVATDKSGATYYQYGTDPSVMVVGKNYASAGTTGTVTVPCGVGRPAFVGMYVFFTPAPDVSVSLGAA